ncbi:MAG: biotin--[acetyl-CoA-carboxylase] ligase [Gammaproteobacteria bacterium]|nr:biotin--[acetyl-CoA-carboxylase] ligase [Gammaproteobacteria bacterium]
MDEQTLRNLLNLESEKSLDRIQIFEEIDSTNSELLRQIQAGSTENQVVIASSQTAGRGRRGRQWLSPKNGGIYLSLARHFSMDANALQALSLVTAISVLEALKELGAQGLQLKWPNDVLFEKKKLAGILLELQQKEALRFVVFGIGVNIELSADSMERIDRPVTDLNSIINEPPSRVILVAALLNRLCRNLENYESSGFSSFEARWNELDCYRMIDIEIQNGESRLIGKSLGVDSEGSLLLQTAKGIQRINGGEVFPSLRPLTE